MAHIVVVGAGAAGLFAAGSALRLGHKVTLIEHMQSPGKKLLITGKGRCNITNNCDVPTFLQGVRRNPKFLYSAAYALPPERLMQMFEQEMSLPLKTERGRRVFPQSDRAQDVLNALLQYAHGAKTVQGRAVSVAHENGVATGVLLNDGRCITGDAVLLACGGTSYPATGSQGLGYAIAQQLGHNIVPPEPSLVSLVESSNIAKRMMGLSLRNVTAHLIKDGKELFSQQGEMLFTHFGLSGPLILSASAFVQNCEAHRYEVRINLKPALSAEELNSRIQRDFELFSNHEVSHCLDKLLPRSMRDVMIDMWGVPKAQKTNQVTRQQRQRLVELVQNFTIPIAKKGSLEHAVITAGGVDVREVDPKTMQSRLVSQLYFAGEILDVDAYTGGYNLQIAWCTAYAAVNAI